MSQDEKESFSTGVIFMLLSATGLALTGLLGKIALEDMDITALIFWRFFVSFILCLILMWALGDLKKGFHLGNIKMHLLRAFFVLTTQYCYYYYLEMNSLLDALVLINMGPLFIPIIEWAVLRQKVGISTWISVIVSFIGVIFIIHPDAGLFSSMSWIGLSAGLTQGASQVVFGINSKTERSDLGVLYLFFLCAFFSLLPFLFVERSLTIAFSKAPLWIYWVIIGLGAASLFNQLFRAVAYRHGTPSRLSCFMYVSVLLAGVWDWMFFDMIPTVFSIIGAALVVFGGLLKVYFRFKILQKRG